MCSPSAPGSRRARPASQRPLTSKRAGKRAANVPKPTVANSDLPQGRRARRARGSAELGVSRGRQTAIEGDLEATLAAVAAGDDRSAVSCVPRRRRARRPRRRALGDGGRRIFEECAASAGQRAAARARRPRDDERATAHVMAMLRVRAAQGALRKLGPGFCPRSASRRRPRRARATRSRPTRAVEPRGGAHAAPPPRSTQRVDIGSARGRRG